jgi:hypothetical protein
LDFFVFANKMLFGKISLVPVQKVSGVGVVKFSGPKMFIFLFVHFADYGIVFTERERLKSKESESKAGTNSTTSSSSDTKNKSNTILSEDYAEVVDEEGDYSTPSSELKCSKTLPKLTRAFVYSTRLRAAENTNQPRRNYWGRSVRRRAQGRVQRPRRQSSSGCGSQNMQI